MPPLAEPMYGWALDARGRPIPIGAAKRGAQGYYCPICNSSMIARKGAIKQFHFAHEELLHCSPEAVATAIGGRWLVLSLGEAMVLHQPVTVKWTIAKQPYEANVLENVVAIVENLPTPHGQADMALKTADDKIKAIISLRDDIEPIEIERFATGGIPVILPDVKRFRSGQIDLQTLMAEAVVHGGWQLLGAEESQIITDAEQIRDVLRQSVTKTPHQFWGALQSEPPHDFVLTVNDKKLWLPPEVWNTIIGGSRNQLSELDVIIKEWPADTDGNIIWLFYVTLRDTSAVAVRRFASRDQAHASLNMAYHLRRTTAEQVAHLLATT